MNIKFENFEPEPTLFISIPYGEAFMLKDGRGSVFIRVLNKDSNDADNYKAVDLITGEICQFNHETVVKKLDANIVVRIK